ncbi:hypothetical protein B0H13DRAFT_1888940 [Mycena leptocephala]|nr:hypothetical protein B0H13DRAFT_1888940 [Mycena leptocephala]
MAKHERSRSWSEPPMKSMNRHRRTREGAADEDAEMSGHVLGELQWTVGELEQGPTYKRLKNEGGCCEGWLESTVVELAVDNGECPPLRILFAEALGNKMGHICGCARYTWGGKKTLPRISTSVRALRATNAFQFRIRLSEESIQLQSQVELASCVEIAYLEVCGKFAMVGACLQNFGWVRRMDMTPRTENCADWVVKEDGVVEREDLDSLTQDKLPLGGLPARPHSF